LTSDEATLALYYFDEGTGDVLHDASGNGHDGKIVGAKWVNSKSGDLTSQSDSPAPEISNLKSQIQNAPGWHGWPADAPPAAIAPFNAEQAKQHQEAWAKYLGVPAKFTDKHGTKYVLIPPGEFQMGFSQTELDTLTRELKQAGANEYDLFSASTSAPQHTVRITKPFYMSAHEVTVAEYRRFIDETHYMTTAEQLGGQRKKWSEHLAPENSDRHPVVGVSWTDAETYCVRRSEQDGVSYRLPSEAEWEYACRAGTESLWSFGDNPALISEHAVTAPEGTSTQPVGSRKSNPLGLFDMYGNADEWCDLPSGRSGQSEDASRSELGSRRSWLWNDLPPLAAAFQHASLGLSVDTGEFEGFPRRDHGRFENGCNEYCCNRLARLALRCSSPRHRAVQHRAGEETPGGVGGLSESPR
jgi:formylglycine-generating enzyme required for sulfatase activity